MLISVIVFAGFFLPFRGGYANSIFQLSKRLVSRGHKVTIITTNTEGVTDEEIINGVKVVRLSCWKLLGGTFPVPKITIKNFQKIHKVRIDHSTIVSTQTRFFITSFIGLLYSMIHRIPLIHTERGSCHSVVPNKIVYLVGVIVDHIIGWSMVKKAKFSIGVSYKARDFLSHLGAKNAIMIPNGVNSIYLSEGERRLKESYQSLREFVIIYVGRLIYAKGVQDLIHAVKKLLLEKNKLELLIIGEGNYRENLEVLVSELGLSNNVIFLGELDSTAIVKYMSKSDIFINPSYSEGLPTSVLEAGAAGLPVIASDVGGTKDIIISDEYGIVYPAGDQQKLIISIRNLFDYNLRLSMSKKLYHYIYTHFSWDDICIQYEKILLKCVTK